YFTLSYCWGGAEVTRLTKEVFLDFSRAIPFYDLPKTFKDAMVITRKLGYNYIWIDSLCIIQDDPDD
ncbi:heterokaryon incompatibility, partial [Melanomma pulvis-pyrius CBS 109.77]